MLNRYLVAFGEEPIGHYFAESPDEAISDCRIHMRDEAPQMLKDIRKQELEHRGKADAHKFTWTAQVNNPS